MTFTIQYPKTKAGMKQFCKQYGLNALYSGKHWAVRREDANYWHSTVRAELMRQNVPQRASVKPVSITFYWNDRMDCSNHAYIAKMTEDALKGWLIQDDSRRFVKRITNEFWDGDCIKVEVKEC